MKFQVGNSQCRRFQFNSFPQAQFHRSPVAHACPRLPQAIAHRGFKGQYPENTILSIDGAIRAGAQALELDLHISRDGIVVLSHVGAHIPTI